VDQHAGREGSVVPAYDKVAAGPTGVGTRYREVVRLLPLVTGKILSEITRYEPGHCLGYRFSGLGMNGDLVYDFKATGEGTLVWQRQSLRPRGLLALFSAPIRAAFTKAAGRRLRGIKELLESDSVPTIQE
jgi:hypothetical protein